MIFSHTGYGQLNLRSRIGHDAAHWMVGVTAIFHDHFTDMGAMVATKRASERRLRFHVLASCRFSFGSGYHCFANRLVNLRCGDVMSLFVQSEGDSAIVVENGVYKQCDLYTRDGYFYVKLGGGFARLNVDGSTSKPKLRLDFIDTTKALYRDNIGRLCDHGNMLTLEVATRLLGGAST